MINKNLYKFLCQISIMVFYDPRLSCTKKVKKNIPSPFNFILIILKKNKLFNLHFIIKKLRNYYNVKIKKIFCSKISRKM